MSPYEVKLLVHVDCCLDEIPYKSIKLKNDTLHDLETRGIIERRTDNAPIGWQTTKLGRAICTRFYSVDESDFKICEQCGQLIE